MKTLILAPRIVVPNWKREFAMHSSVDQERIITLHHEADGVLLGRER